MDYELAKKLKDVGFPQIGLDDYCRSTSSVGEDFAYEPDLSELIEACGDRFSHLSKDPERKEWGAAVWEDMANPESAKQISKLGKTPSEAVANLYLELKKKKQ